MSSSMSSDFSEDEPPHSSPESKSTRMSVKSGVSKEEPPDFGPEPKPPDTEEQQSGYVRTLCGSSEASCGHQNANPGLQTHLQEIKEFMKIYEHVSEGNDAAGGRTLLSSIYTELYITEGYVEEPQREHELIQMESWYRGRNHETSIRCQDIFKASPEQRKDIRVVLSLGVAGVGKTFSVLKFVQDWARGLENQDTDLVVLLSFRELNLIRDRPYSLLSLLLVFYPSLEEVSAEQLAGCRLLFILDGLDETRLSLDFTSTSIISDVTQVSSLSLLLTNLLKGNLLPAARIWITTRPAAASQIPQNLVDRVTEVRGFKKAQMEEFFKRRFTNEKWFTRIMFHIQSSRSLHVMCRIPVFCWIMVTVVEHMLITEQGGELPTTLTDLYSHFVLVQTRKKKFKYGEGRETDQEFLLKLGRLAFEHLEKGDIMFYQEDLQQCDLDETETSVYSGVCTQIFRRESVIFQKPIYSFVHLSVQEFLAAVYIFHCHTNGKSTVPKSFLGEEQNHLKLAICQMVSGVDYFLSLEGFLYSVMQKSLSRQNGHLDLFVRFLHGLALQSNQALLKGLLGHSESSPEIVQRVTSNLKVMNDSGVSPDRSINIFHCLMEMKDLSVHRQIQQFQKSKKQSKMRLSEIHCSALAYYLQMSEEVLDELDVQKFNTSKEGQRRLIPAVRNCREARLCGCKLFDFHCEVLSSALKSNPSRLTHLDVSHNNLQHSAVKFLCVGLQSPNCRLETLRLERCGLSKRSCSSVIFALRSNPSSLTHLDMSYNNFGNSEDQQVCEVKERPHSRSVPHGVIHTAAPNRI